MAGRASARCRSAASRPGRGARARRAKLAGKSLSCRSDERDEPQSMAAWPAGWSGRDPSVLVPGADAKDAMSAALATTPTTSAATGPDASTLAGRVALVKSVGEECQTEAELEKLLEKKAGAFRLYDGFEPSGRMHIAQGVYKAMNVNKCTAAGGTFVFWVADWFALMNDKMGGDLAKIKDVGEYLVEVWRAAGMVMDRVEFRWASDDITSSADKYWPQMLDMARRFTVARVKKCCTIMGRAEGTLTGAQILYPLMQCTDVFFLRADICQLGVDQRKVNMLARDYCDAANLKFKPIILSHHMLYGLKAGQAKMSKSDADSAIFMEDSSEDVRRKLTNAYCPRTVDNSLKHDGEMQLTKDELKNPCLDYVRHIVFCRPGATMAVGGATYDTAQAVCDAFLDGAISENALKESLVAAVDAMLQPVRDHFANDARAARAPAPRAGDAAARGPRAALGAGADRAAVKGGAKIAAVFAPVPKLACPLSAALRAARSLAAALDADKALVGVVYAADWSAVALDARAGDAKGVAAFHRRFFGAVCGLADLFSPGVSTRLGLAVQSAAILARPSEYWIEVINAGRLFKLDEVQAHVGQSGDDMGARVGCVIAALMRCADVGAGVRVRRPRRRGRPRVAVAARGQVLGRDATKGGDVFAAPALAPLDATSLRLQAADAADDDNVDFWVGDGADCAKRKLKKAFCEPENVAFNPPLDLAKFLVAAKLLPALEIKRSPENGGDKAYGAADLAAMTADSAPSRRSSRR
ncbi:tyrosine-tRNA ligase [Aureococcus anophagefferens]|nr:tyrosine-tRNA ligase [Aureococcus anophagefferens]